MATRNVREMRGSSKEVTMREYAAHRVKREIGVLTDKLKVIQNRCKHTRATKKHRSNTGHYDPSCDKYWTEFSCPVCLRKWTNDGSL